MLKRVPIETAGPIQMFAATRLVATVFVFLALAVLDIPDRGAGLLVVGVLGIPWSVAVLLLARARPEVALNPIVPAVDFSILILLEVVAPATFGGVRVAALFLVASHAHFQGGRRGLAVGALGSLALVLATAVQGDAPVEGDLLTLYEFSFVMAALGTGLVVGTLRSAESESRLRARELTRRTIQSESEVRRRVAESIHDGPVQELIGLDMILSTAGSAADAGNAEESAGLIREARELATRNIRALRDEIVDLGPYAFEEFGFETAIENCMPIWTRRYGLEVLVTIERIDLPPETAAGLFRIVQEAVVNAGRHSHGDTVALNLRSTHEAVELRITDNGRGFPDGNPLGTPKPGHLGLASMRERAELLDGSLDIETTSRGTRVLVTLPRERARW